MSYSASVVGAKQTVGKNTFGATVSVPLLLQVVADTLKLLAVYSQVILTMQIVLKSACNTQARNHYGVFMNTTLSDSLMKHLQK